MTDQETLFKFLEAACLAYQGSDFPAQWAQATTMLSTDPSLGTATLAGAATTGNVAALQKFLEADATCHSTQSGPRSWPPLLYLCYSRIARQDAIGSLELLLAAGADPNAHFIAWGAPFTAITGAVGQGEQGPIRLLSHPHALQLVTRLLDAGAKPNDAQALYNTMLSGDTVWLRLFLSRGLTATDPITWPIEGNPCSLDFVLANAVNHGDMERIELLLDADANVNGVDDQGVSPLHRAAWNDHSEVVLLLLSHGADPTLREKNHNATRHEWAVHNNSAVTAELLHKH